MQVDCKLSIDVDAQKMLNDYFNSCPLDYGENINTEANMGPFVNTCH